MSLWLRMQTRLKMFGYPNEGILKSQGYTLEKLQKLDEKLTQEICALERAHHSFIDQCETLREALKSRDAAWDLLKTLYPCYPDGCKVCPPEDMLGCEIYHVIIQELNGSITHQNPHTAPLSEKVWKDMKRDTPISEEEVEKT